MQLYPAIDIRAGKCVRLRQGDYNQETVFADDPVQVATKFLQQGATFLHLVDLDGAKAGRPVNTETVRKIVEATGLPCQLGGGLRDDLALEQILLETGVTRAIVGTQALKNPDWFSEACRRFPNRLVLGVDARQGMVATEGWLDVSTTPAIDLLQKYRGLPIAALVYTNIANDGMMQGIDPGTIGELERFAELGFPTIASGGVTTLDDLEHLLAAETRQPLLSGAIIGRALYEGTIQLDRAIALCRPRSKQAP